MPADTTSAASPAAASGPVPAKDPLLRLTKAGTLLVFGAAWCAPYVLLDDTLAHLAETGVDVRRINVDTWPQHAEQFRVLSLPTLVWVRDGGERRRHLGAISASELKTFVTRR